MEEAIKQQFIEVEKNLRLATSKIRTDMFYAEKFLQNALQGITNINEYIEREQKSQSKNGKLPIPHVSQRSEPLFAFDEIEKELLKRISGNGLQISRFMEWLKANYGG